MDPEPLDEDTLKARTVREHLSRQDFHEALQYLLAIEAQHDPVVRRGLLTAAIVAYCRPTSGNRMHEYATRSPSLDVESLSQGQQSLHARLRQLRDQCVAHSDYERNSARVAGFPDRARLLIMQKPFDVLDEGIDVPSFIALCETVAKQCARAMRALNAQRLEMPPKQGG